jgi:hypothetical protein
VIWTLGHHEFGTIIKGSASCCTTVPMQISGQTSRSPCDRRVLVAVSNGGYFPVSDWLRPSLKRYASITAETP